MCDIWQVIDQKSLAACLNHAPLKQYLRARAVCMILLCFAVFMPASASAQTVGTTNVDIMTAITVQNDAAMDFGTIIPGNRNSRLRIDPDTGQLSVVDGPAIPAGGTVSRALFTINGVPDERVRISLSQNEILLTRSGGTETMRLGQFRLDGGRNRFLDGSGTAQFAIGAQLRVNGDQASGVYRGSFALTVDYF